MPQTEIPQEDNQESSSSLQSSTPPLQRNQRFLGGLFQPHSISSDSSIETDPDFENLIHVEQIAPLPQYVPIVLPVEPTFEELLRRVTGSDDLQNVESLKIRVISYMVSLQRLPIFMPKLRSLNLEGSVIGSLRDLGCGLVELTHLNVRNCGLRSLDGTNGIPGLETLIADNNMIENVCPCCNLIDLKILSLKENKVKDMGLVSFLSLCPELKDLNLKDNPITVTPGYRKTIKRYIPTLEVLDETPIAEDSTEGGEDNEQGDIVASFSSASSLETTSTFSSHENTHNELNLDDYNLLPSTSHDTCRQLQSEWAETSLASGSNAVRGTILDKIRCRKRRDKSKLSSSRTSLASVSSLSSSEAHQFPDKLSQDNVELELGVVGIDDGDGVSNESRISLDSLQQIIEKWKIECKRKREES